ncbi:hypothetical protein [Legionella quateirensis]|uniref:Uncharacterized protein n=1 Tax=Legionella quateirensis TaxID=45072 RepID=A0A378KWX5_9GAMM|nr:hypothetical protein [Legionella quateirensis]KTD46198.1 hypothetical protein Lqua_2301 [Legionella quateirensis]STY19033.1 Uncharacterised protein [Legionella quateirensis]
MNTSTSVTATQELRALLEIEHANRRAAWYHCLTNCLPYAVFTSGEPEIIFNPAGLTYYNLELTSIVEDRSNITIYTIPELIDTFLINEGVGIAIEARNPKQAIDLSYGDILGFHLYRTFSEPEDHVFNTNKPQVSIIREGMDILISDVPKQILPTASIELLEAIMQHYGLKEAKVKLLYLPETDQHELVFSIDKNQLEPSKTQALLQKLGWYLPRYYSYLVCDLNNVSPLVETH